MLNKTITIQDIKTKGASAISDEEPTLLIVNSKVKSVIIPPTHYESLLDALEELEDIRAIEETKNEPTISFEEAVKEIEYVQNRNKQNSNQAGE